MERSFTKLLIAIIILAASALTSNAQEVGVRGGNLCGGNIGITGAFQTGEFNRVHTSLSVGESIGLDLLWDFLYLPMLDETFYLYTGVGPYALFEKPLIYGATAEIGLEYHFDSVPIVLGLDWRPTYAIKDEINDTDEFQPSGFGFSIRYVLNFY